MGLVTIHRHTLYAIQGLLCRKRDHKDPNPIVPPNGIDSACTVVPFSQGWKA